ncbi:RHS repeat-associated core domain-containing protein [Pseudomonas putida]|uniref:RHS repeat-associated core domain-containing protein n=1 Tax=Pseudomonas putida TaxID=303 RepID=UPI0039B392F5
MRAHVITYRYSAFGFSSPSVGGWRFNGERKDSASNGYLLGNGRRLYNPALMRFTSQDSLSPFSKGGLNCYAFGLNDPINYSDPSGLFATKVMRFIAKRLTKKIYTGDIAWQQDGVTVYSGPSRSDGNMSTLYISSHGKPGFVVGKEYHYSAEALYGRFEQAGIAMEHRQTHFLTCKSTAPVSQGGTSLAEDMAKLTGAQSSGYNKDVKVYGETDKSGKYVDRLLKSTFLDSLFGVTSTKTRAGALRNPHKR